MQMEQLGPYRIGRTIGRGGMGSVYEAQDVNTGQRVAVKALSPQLAAAEGFRERFEAEIESLKTLTHDGIVRLLGYGEHQETLFYSMELVEGQSLEQELAAGRRFDWNETLTLAIQICRALKHAHDHGIVHRDIKPANLLLTTEGRLKIADFGIARLFGSTQLTSAGGVLGTADYMSPEQADGRPVTDKCDQYALGCVMFALLAGRPPFRAKTMPEMLQLQRFAEPEPVRRFASETPEQLERLIMQLLSKEPVARFPNALVLARHMEAMQKALSRPGKAGAGPSAPTRADADQELGATAVFNVDATLAPHDLSIVPLETTDSDVYDAPTLADGAELALEVPALSVKPSATVRAGAATMIEPAPPRDSRFTTVAEARRSLQEEPANAWLVALQLGSLLAAIAALVAGGWWLTRPPSADELFLEIANHVDAGGEQDLRPVSAEIADFLARYPDDSRASEVSAYAQELELHQMERRLRVRARLTGSPESHPVATVFNMAVGYLEADPVRAAAMLEDLLTLYPREGKAKAGLTDEQQAYLTLAERELEKLRERIADESKQMAPLLRDRLLAAGRLEESSPEQALAMYRAIVSLFEDQAWAAEMVAEARQRVAALAP
jgi:hypothetical protein